MSDDSDDSPNHDSLTNTICIVYGIIYVESIESLVKYSIIFYCY